MASHTTFKNVSSPAAGAQILEFGLAAALEFYGHIYTKITIKVRNVKNKPNDKEK